MKYEYTNIFDHGGTIKDIQASYDQQFVASCDDLGSLNIWKTSQDKLERFMTIFFDDSLEKISWHPSSHNIISVSDRYNIYVLKLDNLEKEVELEQRACKISYEGNPTSYLNALPIVSTDFTLYVDHHGNEIVLIAKESGYITVWYWDNLSHEVSMLKVNDKSLPISSIKFFCQSIDEKEHHFLITSSNQMNEIKLWELSIDNNEALIIRFLQKICFKNASQNDEEGILLAYDKEYNILTVAFTRSQILWSLHFSSQNQFFFDVGKPLIFESCTLISSALISDKLNDELSEDEGFTTQKCFLFLTRKGLFYIPFDKLKFKSIKEISNNNIYEFSHDENDKISELHERNYKFEQPQQIETVSSEDKYSSQFILNHHEQVLLDDILNRIRNFREELITQVESHRKKLKSDVRKTLKKEMLNSIIHIRGSLLSSVHGSFDYIVNRSLSTFMPVLLSNIHQSINLKLNHLVQSHIKKTLTSNFDNQLNQTLKSAFKSSTTSMAKKLSENINSNVNGYKEFLRANSISKINGHFNSISQELTDSH